MLSRIRSVLLRFTRVSVFIWCSICSLAVFCILSFIRCTFGSFVGLVLIFCSGGVVSSSRFYGFSVLGSVVGFDGVF